MIISDLSYLEVVTGSVSVELTARVRSTASNDGYKRI